MTSKTRAASLGAGLVQKGEAAPVPVPTTAAIKSQDYYKSLTVKLDRERFERIKLAGVRKNLKSQTIFVQALDDWLEKHGN